LLSTEGVYSRDMDRGNSREGGRAGEPAVRGSVVLCAAGVRHVRLARGPARERRELQRRVHGLHRRPLVCGQRTDRQLPDSML
jgi:hypothetical protein